LIVVSKVQGKLFKKRNKDFAEKYLREIRKFLVEQSPAVIARFGGPAARA
jgi:hypothetical protein